MSPPKKMALQIILYLAYWPFGQVRYGASQILTVRGVPYTLGTC